MSFLDKVGNVFKKILTGSEKVVDIAAHVGVIAAPFVSMFDPPVGTLIGSICTKVVQAEAQVTAAKSGAEKKQIVTTQVMDSVTLAFAFMGKPVPPDLGDHVSLAIDGVVGLLNAAAGLSASTQPAVASIQAVQAAQVPAATAQPASASL